MANSMDDLSTTKLSCSPVDHAAPLTPYRFDSLMKFVNAEHADLLRFLTGKVQCSSAAADLLQELYLRIVTLARPEAVRDPRSFLYTSAKNLAIDYLRKKERALPRSQPLEEALLIPTAEPDAEATIDAKKRLAAVLKAIEELPARQRAAFVLFKFEHKTYEEIAALLRISVRTVEHHISKAMAHCRRRFEAFEPS